MDSHTSTVTLPNGMATIPMNLTWKLYRSTTTAGTSLLLLELTFAGNRVWQQILQIDTR